MNNGGAEKYCDLMREVKDRTYAINRILKERASLGFMPIHVEVVYLQYRKILELIAFGSLVANFDLYSKARADYAREWNARRIVKGIEKLNPRFYPEPIKQIPTPGERASVRLDKVTDPYLTYEDFIDLYEVCGGVLHSENPYAENYKYSMLYKQAIIWGDKIRNLLNAHKICLVGDDGFYLIQMAAERKRPTYTYFELVGEVRG